LRENFPAGQSRAKAAAEKDCGAKIAAPRRGTNSTPACQVGKRGVAVTSRVIGRKRTRYASASATSATPQQISSGQKSGLSKTRNFPLTARKRNTPPQVARMTGGMK
jgi:hypothetical protein